MTSSDKSAGGRAATDSVAQTGQDARLAAHRAPLAFTVSDADEAHHALTCLRRAMIVAEGAQATLAWTRGCEIDREAMYQSFEMVHELLTQAWRCLPATDVLSADLAMSTMERPQ